MGYVHRQQRDRGNRTKEIEVVGLRLVGFYFCGTALTWLRFCPRCFFFYHGTGRLLPSAKQRYSTNPERVLACNRRQRRLMPSATWSIRGQGRLWRILPREASLRRSNHFCGPAPTGVGYHDGNFHCTFLKQSPRLPLLNRRRPRRQYGTMTSAAV